MPPFREACGLHVGASLIVWDGRRSIVPAGRVWRPRNVLQYLPRPRLAAWRCSSGSRTAKKGDVHSQKPRHCCRGSKSAPVDGCCYLSAVETLLNVVFKFVPSACTDRNDRNRDAGGDEAVFDCGCGQIISDKSGNGLLSLTAPHLVYPAGRRVLPATRHGGRNPISLGVNLTAEFS